MKMIDIKLGSHGRYESIADAYIDVRDLRQNISIIYLGTCDNLEEKNRIMRETPDRLTFDVASHYETWEDYVEDKSEVHITHETIHIALFNSVDIGCCRAFDMIDDSDQISDYNS